MSHYVRQDRLKLFDQTLTTMDAAGCDQTQADVEFIWRVGAGTTSQTEIEVWTRQMAVKLDGRPCDRDQCRTLEDLKAIAARVMADTHALSTSITTAPRDLDLVSLPGTAGVGNDLRSTHPLAIRLRTHRVRFNR